MTRLINDVVMPAFKQLARELEKHGRTANIRGTATSAALIVYRNGEEEFAYRIQGKAFPTRSLPSIEVRFRERKGLKLIKAESLFRPADEQYELTDITIDEVTQSFVTHYTRRVQPD